VEKKARPPKLLQEDLIPIDFLKKAWSLRTGKASKAVQMGTTVYDEIFEKRWRSKKASVSFRSWRPPASMLLWLELHGLLLPTPTHQSVLLELGFGRCFL